VTLLKNPLAKIVQDLIGAPGSGVIDVDTGSVDQTLPLVPDIGRRGLAIGPTGGWFSCVLENIHSGADDEVSDINPYQPGAAAGPGAYPASVPRGIDVWLAGVAGHRDGAGGDLVMASMGYNPSNNNAAFGWGEDDAGAPTTPTTPSIQLARFDDLEDTIALMTSPPMITEQGLHYQPLNLRLPRDGVLNFFSESGAAAAFQAIFIIGLFPAGLGQDIAT